MKTVASALVFLAFLGASACSSNSGPRGVPKADLEAEITKIVNEVGVKPESVTCRDDLVGEVGRTTQCEIEASPANALLAPIVTVTSVDSMIHWDLKPALTQHQLERRMVGGDGLPPGTAADSVSCESGLEGEEGNVAYCHIAIGGESLRRAVEVVKVNNLALNFQMLPMLTRAEVEDSLLKELGPPVGLRPDAVTCAGDLQGKIGETVDCVVVAGPETADYLVTVESVERDNQIFFRYEPAQ